MARDNGRSDAHAIVPVEDGGQGAGTLADRHHAREGMRLVAMAARKQWAVPDAVMVEAPQWAEQLARDGKPRDRLRAMETLVAMRKANLDEAVALDKLERLDGGSPTEIVREFKIEFDRMG